MNELTVRAVWRLRRAHATEATEVSAQSIFEADAVYVLRYRVWKMKNI